jgi:hypothetical protein
MNLSGYHLHVESFSGTTDANGDLSCTTAQTPLDSNAVVIHSNNGSYIMKVASVSGTTTKVRFYKIQYDKASNTDSDVSNLPSGVTVATSSGQSTSDCGTVTFVKNGTATLDVHEHTISFIYTHTHSVTNFTTTDSTYLKANGIAVNAVLIYASAE